MRKFYGYFIAIYFCLATAAALSARPDINLSLSQNSWLTPEIFRSLVPWMGAEKQKSLMLTLLLKAAFEVAKLGSMPGNEQHRFTE